MDNSNIGDESKCVDQVLMIIFVVLVIFIVVFFFNTKNKCVDENFNDKLNNLDLNNKYNIDVENIDTENIFGNNYEEINRNKNLILSNIEMHQQEMPKQENESDIDKFLRRINNKYNHVKMEKCVESFSNLYDDNVTQEISMNIDNNVNKFSETENISGFLN